MKKITTIYVHGQRAHADEMVAAAILVAAKGLDQYEIIRTQQEDFSDIGEEDYVLDTGGRHDGIKYFDHHQREDEVAGECAATLVAKAFAPELLTDGVWGDYLKRLALQDTKGLRAVETAIGARVSQFLLMEFGLVKLFERSPKEAVELVADMIRDRMSFLASVRDAADWIEEFTEIISVEGHNALYLTRNYAEEGIESFVINAAQAKILDANSVVATVSFDPRDPSGKTRTLFRTRQGEDVGVDFNKATPAEPKFCHKGGFLLNFVPADEEEWKGLLVQALG